MKRYTSITEKLILNFLLLSLAAIIIVGTFSYLNSRNAIMQRTFDQLTSVRDAKKSNIEHFFNSRINEIKLISQSEEIHRMLQAVYQSEQNPEGKNKAPESKNIHNEYDRYLSKYLDNCGFYSHLYIGNTKGKIAHINISSNGPYATFFYDTLSSFHFLKDIAEEVVRTKTPIITDYEPISDTLFSPLLISAPVYGEDSVFIGFISLEIWDEAINDIMLETNPNGGLGNTGESYLVGQDYLMRSQSRFISKSLLRTEVRTEGTKDALEGNSGTLRIDDYRGIDVFNSHRPLEIQDLKWVILAEIDYSEAMVPVVDLRNKILFLTLLVALLVFLSIFIIARRISKPIIGLKNAAEKIGKGDFDTQLKVHSHDEIGALTGTFNQMALQLKTMTNDLKEREERLVHFYDATLDGIVLHDNGQPLLVNQAMVKLTGYSEKELLDMDISVIFQHEKNSAFRLPLKPYTYETSALKKDKSCIPVEIQVSTIEYKGKMILASVIRDISRRMEVEKELREERLKRLSWVIDGQEIERERLSRELHDGLGQMLVAIKLKLESAIDHEDEKTQSIIRDLRNMFDKTIDEIRRISNDLMPSGLQEFGIVNALRKLGNVISENKSIQVEVEAQNLPEQLDSKTIMYIYRITQEAITNSVKHAQASEIHVKLSRDEHFISLLVGDNGKGFKFDKTHKFVGNGIYNMRERANMMNGTIEIRSETGKGTTVFVQIPIIKN